MNLSAEEKKRYARHLILPQVGEEGQKKLKSAKVLVVGAGGLGSPLLLYLVAAGVGHIGIVEFDTVEMSNLQRQVLYTVDDVGKPKAQAAKKRLLALNPLVDIKLFETRLDVGNALEIISQYDIVADGTDNFPTRYLVNDACVLAQKVNVYAAISRFEGRLSVFNYLETDGTRGVNYRHIFPEPPPEGTIPNCQEGGVLGILPGILGSMQGAEVIKIITGVGQPLAGRMLILDIAQMSPLILNINKKHKVEIKELMNLKKFCNFGKKSKMVKEITAQEYKTLVAENADFQLIDVRESFEYEESNLGAILIPLGDVMNHVEKISKDKQVVIHCRSGKRSATAISMLQDADPTFDNLYNLKGGILAVKKLG